MEAYTFVDTDCWGEAEYDIRGDAYKELICCCCQYSKIFSMVITDPSSPIIQQLQPYRIATPDHVLLSFPEYTHQSADIAYYRVCPQVREILADGVGGIFEWIDGWGFTNPNDPAFYREDGSVFFASVIHNGVCTLTPRPGEDVSQIIKDPLWIKQSGD